MSKDRIEILLMQYQVVQKSQQDANSRLYQAWLGFGAITTASAALLVTGQQTLVTLAPFAFVLWFCILGIVNYDIQYRAIFLAFLEREINRTVGSDIATLTYESFASANMWKLATRGRWGIPVSSLWIAIGFFVMVALYIGICIFAWFSLPGDSLKVAFAVGYTAPMLIIGFLMAIAGPRQLGRFKDQLHTSQIASSALETMV